MCDWFIQTNGVGIWLGNDIALKSLHIVKQLFPFYNPCLIRCDDEHVRILSRDSTDNSLVSYFIEVNDTNGTVGDIRISQSAQSHSAYLLGRKLYVMPTSMVKNLEVIKHSISFGTNDYEDMYTCDVCIPKDESLKIFDTIVDMKIAESQFCEPVVVF